MQNVNGAKLIFRDAIRSAEIIRYGALGRVIVLRRVAEISEYIIDLLLRKDAVRHLSIYRSCSRFLYLSYNQSSAAIPRSQFRLPGLASRRSGAGSGFVGAWLERGRLRRRGGAGGSKFLYSHGFRGRGCSQGGPAGASGKSRSADFGDRMLCPTCTGGDSCTTWRGVGSR